MTGKGSGPFKDFGAIRVWLSKHLPEDVIVVGPKLYEELKGASKVELLSNLPTPAQHEAEGEGHANREG